MHPTSVSLERSWKIDGNGNGCFEPLTARTEVRVRRLEGARGGRERTTESGYFPSVPGFSGRGSSAEEWMHGCMGRRTSATRSVRGHHHHPARGARWPRIGRGGRGDRARAVKQRQGRGEQIGGIPDCHGELLLQHAKFSSIGSVGPISAA